MLWFWLALGLVLLAAEVQTTAFFAVFIAIGCFVAAVTAGIGWDLLPQVAVGGAIACIGMALARPPLRRWADSRRGERRPSPGTGSLPGRSGLVVEEVGDEHHPGHVMVDGERWLAVTPDGVLHPEQRVVVLQVRGTTLVVRAAGAIPRSTDRGGT